MSQFTYKMIQGRRRRVKRFDKSPFMRFMSGSLVEVKLQQKTMSKTSRKIGRSTRITQESGKSVLWVDRIETGLYGRGPVKTVSELIRG